jgi:hypothetical protein
MQKGSIMKRVILALVIAGLVLPGIAVLADDEPGVGTDAYTVVVYRAQRVNIETWYLMKQEKNAAKRERIEEDLAECEAELADVQAAIDDPLTAPEELPGLEQQATMLERQKDKLESKLGDKLAAQEAKKSATLERQYDKKLQQLRKRAEKAGIDWAAEDALLFP